MFRSRPIVGKRPFSSIGSAMVAADRAKIRRGFAGRKYGSAAVIFPTNSGMRTGGFIPAGWRRSSTSNEIKSVDFVTSASVDSPGTVQVLNNLQSGASFYQRIGRQVKMKSLRMRAYLAATTTNTVASIIRIAIVYDAQVNGVAATYNDIFQDVVVGGSATNTTTSGVNLNNRDRFRVLLEEFWMTPTTGPQTSGDIGQVVLYGGPSPNTKDYYMDRYINLKNLVTTYKSDSGTTGDISTGALYLVVKASQNTPGFVFNPDIRIRYED